MSSPSKTVLVTGGNGYLASAVVLHFLQHGYRVRATVRSLSKAEGLRGFCFPEYESSLSFHVVEDMTVDGAYAASGALQGVDAICHVASPVPDVYALPAASGADWVRDMVDPAVDGTRAILQAASSSPQVRHLMLTSSNAALQSFATLRADPKARTARLTEADWNEQTRDDPELRSNALAAYFASKACAERAAWQYVKEHSPHWTLATFCPPLFFGPAAIKPKSPSELGSSLGVFYRLMQGEAPIYPMNGNFVDVRDIAQAFRLAIELPLSQHERFLLGSGAETSEEVVAFAKSGDPEVLKDRPTGFDTTKARQMLGWKPRSKRDTFVDMAAFLKQAEKSFTK